MRRKLLVLLLVVGAALALAGLAAAGNDGFAPRTPHSPNANRINDSYDLISLFTGAIFLIVEGSLVWFVFKYRSRGRRRTVEGPQIHAHARLELIWTAVPVLILAIIGAYVFYKLPGIKDVPAAKAQGGPLEIRIDAHQFYWQFTYPNGAVSIDSMHAPVGKVVRVDIASQDVDHSWWIPELGGKFDAIPGHRTHTWFRADRVGTYRGQCGEFCGVFHAKMEAQVEAEPQQDYQAFVTHGAAAELGRSEWAGACAKCHGFAGQGDFGPKISQNGLLVQPAGLRSLILNGRGRMPPVTKGWSDQQYQALYAYLKKSVFVGAASGG